MDIVSIAAAIAAGFVNAAMMVIAFIQAQAILVLTLLGFAKAALAIQLAVLAGIVIAPVAVVAGLVVLGRKMCEEDDGPLNIPGLNDPIDPKIQARIDALENKFNAAPSKTAASSAPKAPVIEGEVKGEPAAAEGKKSKWFGW